MGLQVIKDSLGQNAGVFIPMKEWKLMTRKYHDLEKILTTGRKKSGVALSDLAGKLSKKTGQDLTNHVSASRDEWEERLTNQRR